MFRVGTDQTGQFLDIAVDLRDAPLTIMESGCNANTNADSEHTTREIARQVGVIRKKRSKLKEGGRCSTIQFRLRETVAFGSRQIGPCGNSKTRGPETE